MGRRRRGGRKDRPRRACPDATIQAVPQWIVATGGIGHAVRARAPRTTAYCGATDFRGGFFTPATPRRVCRECAESLGYGGVDEPTLPELEPPASKAPVVENQGTLF